MSDIFFNDKGDGGEFLTNGADLATDDTYYTALYLSLFQGRSLAEIFAEHKTDREFEKALSLPVTPTNINKLNALGEKATDWLLTEGIAESIEFSAFGDTNSKLGVNITVTEPSMVVRKYAVIWENEKIRLIGRQ